MSNDDTPAEFAEDQIPGLNSQRIESPPETRSVVVPLRQLEISSWRSPDPEVIEQLELAI